MKKQEPRTKFSDPMIVPRVKTYLAENVDKTFVDVGQMARSLKERYREYNNRNDGAFCQMVESAYKVVLKSYGLDEASSTDGSDDESDEIEMLEDSNVLNDQIMAMYKMQEKKGNGKKERGADKTSELIDILSSDEESSCGKAPKFPKLNDQITISPHIPDTNQQKPKPVIPVVSINASTDVSVSNKYDGNQKIFDKKRKVNHENAPKTPSSKRKPTSSEEEKVETKITFDDVGGIAPILEQVCDLIMHMKHGEVYKQLGVKTPRGALLHGPPGTGKTLLAHAIAGRLGLPLLSICATEMVGGLSGESEKRIRELFEKATALAPCVLFIDEIDSICANRMNAQKDMERRIVAQLLSSIDSLGEKESSVLVLAATNSPDNLDPALRRAGRLEQEIALGIPTLASRADILRIMCRGLKMDPSIDLHAIAQLTPGFVGADLQALINKACTVAIKRVFKCLKEQTIIVDEVSVDSQVPEVTTKSDPPVSRENGTLITDPSGNLVTGDQSESNALPSLDESVAPVEPSAEVSTPSSEETVIPPVEGVPSSFNESTVSVNQNETCPSAASAESCISAPVINHTLSKSDVVKNSLSEIEKYLDASEPFTPEQLASMIILQEDILIAMKTTKPCAFREGFATVPDTTWQDIGSLKDVRRDLQLAVLAPVKYPEHLESLGLTVPSGVLLCGPPGCGKTLLAKAVANEAGINFISVKGPELLNMYVGESERAVRTCFQRARNSAPCVIFFDEFDSLCPRRTNGNSGGATRVVNQLLTEMDGVEGREGVFVLAATNRPDIIDPAILRPGRLDRVIYVGMPSLRDRIDILKAITKKGTKPQLASDVELSMVASVTEGYTGADLAGLVRLAATQALTDFITGVASEATLSVSLSHFHKAIEKTNPSVSPKDQEYYEKLRMKYHNLRENDVEMDAEESMDTV